MEGHDQTKADVATYLRAVASDPSPSPNAAAVPARSERIVGQESPHLPNLLSAVTLPFDQVRNAPTWTGTQASRAAWEGPRIALVGCYRGRPAAVLDRRQRADLVGPRTGAGWGRSLRRQI